jgi:urea transport system permease protein
VAIVTLTFLAGTWLLSSRFGRLLRATRDNTNRVRFLGYDPTPYKIVAFAISGALAGISGALFALHAGVISPALVSVTPSIEMVVWAAVGGRISLGGAIAGALAVNFAKDKISSVLPEAWLYILGLIFILVVTAMPKGLAGMMPARLPTFRRRAAVTPEEVAP